MITQEEHIQTSTQAPSVYGLAAQTPNAGINQKIGPMWQTKYALAVPKNLGLGFDFGPCSEGDFLTWRP